MVTGRIHNKLEGVGIRVRIVTKYSPKSEQVGRLAECVCSPSFQVPSELNKQVLQMVLHGGLILITLVISISRRVLQLLVVWKQMTFFDAQHLMNA